MSRELEGQASGRESLPTAYYDDGTCTIYHGDSREILPLLAAEVMVTDPPYGYAFQSGWSGRFKGEQIANDGDTAARDAVLAAWGSRPAIVFGSWKRARPEGTRAVLIWDKGDDPRMGDLTFPWGPSFEEAYVLGEGFEGRRTGSLLRFAPPSKVSSVREHPNEKPVPMMRALIEKCPPGVIVDPFMGSGSTLRAAKDLGRRCIGIEVDERWCKVAVARLAQEVLTA